MKLLKLNKKKKSQFTVGIFISWRGLIMLEFGDLIRSRSSSFRQIRTTCRHRKKSISGTIHKLRNQKTKNRHKVKIIKKTAWIQSYLLSLQWKFKLLAGKFTWCNKTKHCWAMSTNVLFSKVCWQHPAMFCLYISRP